MLPILIVGCEIGFWLFVIAGLVCRYVWNLPKVGVVLLACTPLVDLVLLVATGLDLRNGSSATFIHSLSAIYLGVSIVYGHRMIRWADERFVHRFKKGPAPARKPKGGIERARYERKMWYYHAAAWGIGSFIMFALIWWIGDSSRTEALQATIQTWSVVVVIDFIVSFSYTIWPKKEAG